MALCLIADDSKVIRMLLNKIMSNLNFDVIEAEDGEEVVELAELKNPDLIILDWFLPNLSGVDVLHKIRNSVNIKQPKIIFCSSMLDLQKIRQALKEGADDYIMKPFDEDIISSKLAYLEMI